MASEAGSSLVYALGVVALVTLGALLGVQARYRARAEARVVELEQDLGRTKERLGEAAELLSEGAALFDSLEARGAFPPAGGDTVLAGAWVWVPRAIDMTEPLPMGEWSKIRPHPWPAAADTPGMLP